MSKHKQEKIITEKKPHIVIATPGRLWDLMNHFPVFISFYFLSMLQTNVYLRDASDLQFLILDEADRMIDYGHFQELQFILAALSGYFFLF